MQFLLSAFALLLLLFSQFSGLRAQTFQFTYGQSQVDLGYSITPAGNGRYAISGQSESNNNSTDGLLMLVDSNGVVQWTRYAGTSATEEEAEGVAVVGANVFICGYTDDPGPGQFNGWLQKYELGTGNLVATRGCGISLFEQIDDLDAAPDGRLYGSGLSFQNGLDFFVTRWDTSLNLLWARTVGSPGSAELGFDGKPTSDGGFLAFGATSQGAGSDDIMFCKLDSNGNLQWTRIYGTLGQDFINDVIEIGGGYLAVGRANPSSNNTDVLLLRLDSGGNLVWSKTYGGSGSENGYDVKWDGSELWVTGQTLSFGFGGSDGFIFKADSSGNVILARAYGGSQGDLFLDMEVLQGGGVLAVGSSASFGAGQDDVYLVRTDAQGSSGCHDTIFNLTAVSLSMISTTPSGVVAAAAGTAVNKTWTSTATTPIQDTLCGPPPCAVIAAASLNATGFCLGDTLIATDISTGSSSRTWSVNGNTLTFPGSPLPLVQLTPGLFDLQIIASDGNCSDTAVYSYQVFPQVSFNTSADSICADDSLFAFNSTPGATGGMWYINGNLVSSGLNAAFGTSATGVYELVLESVPGNCRDTSAFVVVPNAYAFFNYTSQNTSFSFLSNSPGATSYFWDFGDGNTSTQPNPQHTYAGGGAFQVCLTVSSGSVCTDMYCDTVTSLVGMDDPLLSAVRLYPNPASEVIQMELPAEWAPVRVEMRDVQGRLLGEWRHAPATGERFRIDVREYARGFYQLRLIGEKGESSLPFMKQ